MPSVPRVVLLGLAIAVLAAAVFFVLVDDMRGAVGAAVIAAPRSSCWPAGRDRRRFQVGTGSPSRSSSGGVIGPTLIAAGVFVALVTLKVVASMGFARCLRRVELEPVPPEFVMEGAEGVVASFETKGFRRLGGHRMRVGRTLLATTVLAGRDDDRLANVPDRVWEVASRFGRRWLITISSGLAPLTADVLRQDVCGDDPSHVARAHKAALQLLARRGLRPDRFGNDTEVLEAAREIDLRSSRLSPTLLWRCF